MVKRHSSRQIQWEKGNMAQGSLGSQAMGTWVWLSKSQKITRHVQFSLHLIWLSKVETLSSQSTYCYSKFPDTFNSPVNSCKAPEATKHHKEPMYRYQWTRTLFVWGIRTTKEPKKTKVNHCRLKTSPSHHTLMEKTHFQHTSMSFHPIQHVSLQTMRFKVQFWIHLYMFCSSTHLWLHTSAPVQSFP